MIEDDKRFMELALGLARRGAGLVSPNPLVGAALVNAGRVVGEGYHLYGERRHAESYAIEKAGSLARGATLYCNLEPCSHYGRTPPCTDTLIEAGIARAIVASSDPNPLVNGGGISQLRQAGINVEVGVCEDEALRINETYFKYITSGLPFVHAVIDQATSDSNPSGYLSLSPTFIRHAAEYDAIAIGPAESSTKVLDACLNNKRHRPLIVIGKPDAFEKAILRTTADRQSDAVFRIILGSEATGNSFDKAMTAEPRVSTVLKTLSELQATSCLILPGSFDDITLGHQSVDKFTVLSRSAQAQAALSDVDVLDDGEYLEITGYARAIWRGKSD